jgi:hypothetical protein
LKQLRIDIRNRLNELKEEIGVRHVNTWNSQDQQIEERDNYPFDFPAVFPEIITDEVKALGEGLTIYDPLDLRIHILHRLEDCGDGNMDENLDVEDIRSEVKRKLHKWMPDGTSGFFEMEEERDYTHTNLYHLILTFRSNYVDNSTLTPIGGTDSVTPIEIEVEATIDTNLNNYYPNNVD